MSLVNGHHVVQHISKILRLRFFCWIILVILGAYISSCTTIGYMENNSSASKKILPKTLERPHGQEIKAVILILHGLNLKPQKMDDWAQVLKDKGAILIRPVLFGHDGDPEHMRDANAQIWRRQFEEAMILAKDEASINGHVPIYFLGFSLGALVGLDWLAHAPAEHSLIKKMVLVAPAIATPWYSQAAVKIFSVFGRGFIMPARSPKDYRANKGTSIAAYEALFAIKKSLESSEYKNANIKTLVLIDKDDELVSSKAIAKTTAKYRLGLWNLDIVDNKFAHEQHGFRHLLVDKSAMGEKLWLEISSKVIKHFGL